jgi:hypothetical protein
VDKSNRIVGPWRFWLGALTISALVSYVFWPGLHAFWGRDDFGVIALLRMIDSPWLLFTQDHYPVPGSVFRPLGFASMWLCERWLGTDYAAQATVDLSLHIAVALAFFRLLLRAQIPSSVATICALLFALHPVVIGTALWWSARFDLLATLFSVVAVDAALAYRAPARVATLLVALLAALAAMLSKEIGLVAIATLSLVWLRWAWAEPAQRTRALCAVGLAWLCALFFLGWRWLVLGTWTSGVTGSVSLRGAFVQGLLNWSQQWFAYLTFWERLGAAQRVMLGAAVCAAIAVVGVAITLRRLQMSWRGDVDLVLCGLCLLFLPVLLQAPIAAFGAALSPDVSAVQTAMQSRLYYLGMIGVAALVAAVVSVLWRASGTALRIALVLPVCLVVAAFAWTSRDSAQAFAERSVQISDVARVAVVAVAQLDLPPPPCHVVFMDVGVVPEWGVYVPMDSVVKALSPDLDRVKHCWFHTNYGTPFHLQAAPALPADAAPYLALQVEGKQVPWMTIGDLVIAYVRAPASVEPGTLLRMKFLRYRDGRFDDVSAEVAKGSIAVDLR